MSQQVLRIFELLHACVCLTIGWFLWSGPPSELHSPFCQPAPSSLPPAACWSCSSSQTCSSAEWISTKTHNDHIKHTVVKLSLRSRTPGKWIHIQTMTWHYIRKLHFCVMSLTVAALKQAKVHRPRTWWLVQYVKWIIVLLEIMTDFMIQLPDAQPHPPTVLLRMCVWTHVRAPTQRQGGWLISKRFPESFNARGITMVTSLQVSICPIVCLNTSVCGHSFFMFCNSQVYDVMCKLRQ